MFEGLAFSALNSPKAASLIAAVGIALAALGLILRQVGGIQWKRTEKILYLLGQFIGAEEKRYHRDVAIGKLTEKRLKVKIYKFLNDLIIDLGLKVKGANPYSFLFVVAMSSVIISLILGLLIFSSMFLGLLVSPIVFAALMCGIYTKANVAHDTRIEAIIEAENIISNNIKDGVVVAVKNSIEMIPQTVRQEFRDFLDNIEYKNYHIKTALLELGNNLGSVADDFIKKCIIFEMEEEHGLAGIFKDVVEVNNIKTELRNEMKRRFEEVTTEFVIGALMIFIFLGGTMAVFSNVADFYLKTFPGQLILMLDFLIIVTEFVYLTYLRAKEL